MTTTGQELRGSYVDESAEVVSVEVVVVDGYCAGD